MARFFNNCSSLDELKATYKDLALKNHPDMGGDNETMKQINAEYDVVFAELKTRHNVMADNGETFTGTDGKEHKVWHTDEAPEDFKLIIALLVRLDVEVELCGSWLWIGGDTKPVKEDLKACGCKWSANKCKWYWRPAEQRKAYKHKAWDMNTIRSTYGSHQFAADDDKSKQLVA